MSIDIIRQALAEKAGPHLGDLIWWSLADARIDRATLESLWADTGLDSGLLPDAPSAEKAVKLAVREASVGASSHLIRLGKECDSEIIFNVVREDSHADGSLDYTTEARITLDCPREVCSSDCPGHDLVAVVQAKFETYKSTHPVDDVRRTIVKALHSFAAVTLRDGGGVYWVPAPFSERSDASKRPSRR